MCPFIRIGRDQGAWYQTVYKGSAEAVFTNTVLAGFLLEHSFIHNETNSNLNGTWVRG